MAISMSRQSMSRDLLHHQEPDEHQRRHGRLGGDRGHQRGEEHREQEEHAGDDRGEARTSALPHAGGRLDVGGVATRRRPRHRRWPRWSRRSGCAAALGGVPSSSLRPASAPIAVIVPIVSKKSASSSEKTSSSAASAPPSTEPKAPNRSTSPSGVERRQSDEVAAEGRHAQRPAAGVVGRGRPEVGDRLDRRRRGRCWPGSRSGSRRAPCGPTGAITSTRPRQKTRTGQPDEVAVGAELHRHGGLEGVGDAGDEPGVDEADQGDEQADPDRDRDLELLRARRGRPPCGSRSAPARG